MSTPIAILDISLDFLGDDGEPKVLNFQLKKMKPTDVFKLDKTLMAMVAPALGGLGKNSEGKLSIDFTKSAGGLANLLVSLPDDQYMAFLTAMLSRVTWISPVKGAQNLGTHGMIDSAFEESGPILIYQLIWHVMRFNKFSFFGLKDFGAGILQTLGLQKQTPNVAANGEPSGTLEP